MLKVSNWIDFKFKRFETKIIANANGQNIPNVNMLNAKVPNVKNPNVKDWNVKILHVEIAVSKNCKRERFQIRKITYIKDSKCKS